MEESPSRWLTMLDMTPKTYFSCPTQTANLSSLHALRICECSLLDEVHPEQSPCSHYNAAS